MRCLQPPPRRPARDMSGDNGGASPRRSRSLLLFEVRPTISPSSTFGESRPCCAGLPECRSRRQRRTRPRSDTCGAADSPGRLPRRSPQLPVETRRQLRSRWDGSRRGISRKSVRLLDIPEQCQRCIEDVRDGITRHEWREVLTQGHERHRLRRLLLNPMVDSRALRRDRSPSPRRRAAHSVSDRTASRTSPFRHKANP